jgi:hypothetical protein
VGLFVTGDKYPGANSNTKRALAAADLGAPSVTKLREAAKLAKLKVEFPVWKESAWAHVGIPSKKVAVAILPSHLTQKSQLYRESWGRFGWKCLCVSKADVDSSTADCLATELVAAIAEVTK